MAVQPGGCAGLRYALYFDDRKLDDDLVDSVNGVEIRCDKMSAPYLAGAEIDYVDSLAAVGLHDQQPERQGHLRLRRLRPVLEPRSESRARPPSEAPFRVRTQWDRGGPRAI